MQTRETAVRLIYALYARMLQIGLIGLQLQQTVCPQAFHHEDDHDDDDDDDDNDDDNDDTSHIHRDYKFRKLVFYHSPSLQQ